MKKKCFIMTLFLLALPLLFGCGNSKEQELKEERLNQKETTLNEKESKLNAREQALTLREEEVSQKLAELKEKEEQLLALESKLKAPKEVVPVVVEPEVATPIPPKPAKEPETRDKWAQFEEEVTAVTKAYIGMPYEYGATPDKSGKTDNSHLIFSIFAKAAGKAGLDFADYMPVDELLAKTYEIKPEDIRCGDIHVLSNNHAAVIYQLDDRGNYSCAYTSEKKREVVSAESGSPDFEVYWVKNLKGYYRLKDELFKKQ